MSGRPNCFHCRFWRPLFNLDDPKADPQWGQCKRHAPVIASRDYDGGKWPQVHRTEECGEFENRPENADRPSAETPSKAYTGKPDGRASPCVLTWTT
jgi:hypothetical protein